MTFQLRSLVLAIVLGSCFGLSAQADLRLTGNDPGLSDRLTRESRALNPEDGARPSDIVAAAKGDYARLLGVLYEEGYFGPTVSIRLNGKEAADLSPLATPTQVLPVTITVDPGKRFTFGRAEVAPLPADAALGGAFAPGQPAGTAQIRRAARNGIAAWRNAAHAQARVADQAITARHASAQLDAVIRIDPGPPLRFGQLVTASGSAVRTERLRTIAGLPSGAPFHPDEIDRARQRLIDTGAFRSVVLRESETANPDQTLDMILQVEDAAPRRIGFGAELSTRDGLSFEAFWLHRNAFGGAERLRFDFNIDGIAGDTGGEDFTLGSSLTIPGFRRPDDRLIYEVTLGRRNEETYSASQFETTLSRERQVNDNLTLSLGTGLRFSDVETDAFGAQTYQHLLLPAEAVYDLRDDADAPTRGTFTEISLTPFIGLGGSSTGLRFLSDLRAYRSLNDRTVLAGRFQLGSVIGTSLADTPPAFVFLSGGGGTVRGQDFQSLGVNFPAGRYGGRGFAGLSAEIRRDIGRNLGLVGFIDYGYVSESSDLSGGDSHSGAGIGARYKSGLGTFRLDLGFPLSGDTSGGFSLYIGIGEAF